MRRRVPLLAYPAACAAVMCKTLKGIPRARISDRLRISSGRDEGYRTRHCWTSQQWHPAELAATVVEGRRRGFSLTKPFDQKCRSVAGGLCGILLANLSTLDLVSHPSLAQRQA